MKLNDVEVVLSQANIEKVEGSYIIHDSISDTIMILNETSSFIWNVLLEHEKINKNLDTSTIVEELMIVYDIPENSRQQILLDIEEIIQCFFTCDLLKAQVDNS